MGEQHAGEIRASQMQRICEERDVLEVIAGLQPKAFEMGYEQKTIVLELLKGWVDRYVSSVKHPVLESRLADVVATLSDPLEVRRSTKDPAVLLFYRAATPRFLCVVTRKEAGAGFLITAYPTDSLKKGEIVWSASE